jgi:NAD-dependent SIR2 family protein deacetylase
MQSQFLGNLMRSIPLEDACYQSKPEKAWFYDAGYREAIVQSVPHEGYNQLLQLLKHLNKPHFVMTTNIDRYFAKSGFPEELLFETHGSVEGLQCAKIGPDRCEGVWLWPEETPLPVFNKKDITCDLDTGKWRSDQIK